MNKTAAVIVTCNSEAEIGPCLDAALAWLDEIVVIDNASLDRTGDEVRKRPSVRWIRNSSNRGFAAAVNQGVSSLSAGCVLLLNPDAVLLTGIEPLVEACRQPGVAAAAGKLVGGDGRPQAGFSVRRFPTPWSLSFEILGLNRLWPSNPVNKRFRCLDMNCNTAADVEQPAGAFLLIRRDVWLELNGLDEEFYPLWFEDVDLLKRVQDRGYRVAYVPSVGARHAGGHSVRKIPRERRDIYWYANLLRYSSKHFAASRRRAVCGVLLLGSMVRMVSGFLLERNLKPFNTYGAVMRLAFKHLVGGQMWRSGEAPSSGETVAQEEHEITESCSEQNHAHGTQRFRLGHHRDLQQRPVHSKMPRVGAGPKTPG